jgi:type IV secretory pathway VirB2 component (pilin)
VSVPVPGNSIVTAVTWLEQLLTGTLATSLAVLAIAGLGYRLLTGQLEPRRALQVVLGIFILFGAPALVRELMAVSRGTEVAAPEPGAAPEISTPAAPNAPLPRDPYAGAAVPG